MKYDDLLTDLGEFGRYQKFQYLLVCLVAISSSMQSMNIVFVGPTPDHYCNATRPGWMTSSNLTEQQQLNLTIPMERHEDGSWRHSRCQVYVLPAQSDGAQYDGTLYDGALYDGGPVNNGTTRSCTAQEGWIYSTQFYGSTIVSEWDMVCERASVRGMATTIFFGGRLVGGFFSGILSDRFGRRPVFFVSVLMQLVSGLTASFAPWLWLFYIAYFLQGLFQTAIYLCVYVLGTEVVGSSYRKVSGIGIRYFYALGQLVLCGVAYGLRRWRLIEIAINVPTALFFSYYWCMNEPVRWLMSRGRRAEAERVIVQSARMNRVDLPNNILDDLELEDKSKHTYSIIDIVRRWQFAKIAITVWYAWFSNAMVYYGLNYYTSSLGGDPYLNFALAALVEMPSYTLTIALLDRVGRRTMMITMMLMAGAACMSAPFIPPDLPFGQTGMAMFGKFCITATYAIIYLMAAEVFPTVVRSAGVGTASVCARLAGMITPQILILGDIQPYLPLLVFGISAALGGLLCIPLPETTGKPLPQNFSDAQQNGKEKKGKSQDVEHADVTDTTGADANNTDADANHTDDDANHTDADANHTDDDANHTDADANHTDADANHTDTDINHTDADANHTDTDSGVGSVAPFDGISYTLDSEVMDDVSSKSDITNDAISNASTDVIDEITNGKDSLAKY